MICKGVEIQRKERYHTDKKKKVSLASKLFPKMKFFLSFVILSNRIQNYVQYQENTKNSDKLRACIEKAYVVVT